MESSKHNWASISETICLTMLVFGKKASWLCFFRNILTNPIISQIQFFMTSHFSTLLSKILFNRSEGERNYFSQIFDNSFLKNVAQAPVVRKADKSLSSG